MPCHGAVGLWAVAQPCQQVTIVLVLGLLQFSGTPKRMGRGMAPSPLSIMRIPLVPGRLGKANRLNHPVLCDLEQALNPLWTSFFPSAARIITGPDDYSRSVQLSSEVVRNAHIAERKLNDGP